MIVATQLSVSKYLEAAVFIGAQLCRDAIWSGQRCNWFGVPVREMNRSVVTAAQSICGSDFYKGTSGIAIFLARLFAATSEKIFRTTAEGAIRQALSRLDDFPQPSRSDFYTGLTGVAYGLFEIADSCGIEKFKEMGLLIMEQVAADETSGSLTGAGCGAGTVTQLLRMHRRYKKEFLLRLATKYGEKMRSQVASAADLTIDPPFSELNVAAAMLELFKATAGKEYRQAAEQVLLNVRNKNATNDNVRTARANLLASEVLREDIYCAYAREAIDIICSRIDSCVELDLDFSLAHGLAGDGDLLLEASRVLADEHLCRTAERVGNWGIERYKKDDLPWPCGSATGWDSPSFMTGIAGIGYFYLRLHDSSRVHSLLLV